MSAVQWGAPQPLSTDFATGCKKQTISAQLRSTTWIEIAIRLLQSFDTNVGDDLRVSY